VRIQIPPPQATPGNEDEVDDEDAASDADVSGNAVFLTFLLDVPVGFGGVDAITRLVLFRRPRTHDRRERKQNSNNELLQPRRQRRQRGRTFADRTALAFFVYVVFFWILRSDTFRKRR